MLGYIKIRTGLKDLLKNLKPCIKIPYINENYHLLKKKQQQKYSTDIKLNNEKLLRGI